MQDLGRLNATYDFSHIVADKVKEHVQQHESAVSNKVVGDGSGHLSILFAFLTIANPVPQPKVGAHVGCLGQNKEYDAKDRLLE